jgi:hypothetical protein
LTAVVVLPTPPFERATAIFRIRLSPSEVNGVQHLPNAGRR